MLALSATVLLGLLIKSSAVVSAQGSIYDALTGLRVHALNRPMDLLTQLGDLPTTYGIAVGAGAAIGATRRSIWPLVLLVGAVIVERTAQLAIISFVGSGAHKPLEAIAEQCLQQPGFAPKIIEPIITS